jgi:hypothetical protein
MALVSTGQITIVDNNDAKPLTAFISASPNAQQIYEPSGGTYTDNWTTVNSGNGLLLTAKCYVGGTSGSTDISALMSGYSWKVNGAGASLTTGTVAANTTLDPFFLAGNVTAANTTLYIDANLDPAAAGTVTITWEADYTDPATSLTTHVIASIILSMVKTGTNAVFIQMRGKTAVEEATGATKNAIAVAADLVRATGYDTDNLEIRWYDTNGGTQISTSTASYATKYALSYSAPGSYPTPATINGANVPVSGAWTGWATGNTLSVSETAIADIGVFKAEIRDTVEGLTYTTYFTLYDISDPYDTVVVSSAGDKLQNGQGSTNLTPKVYYGSTEIASYTSWEFIWTFYTSLGLRGGFVDAGVFTAGGQNITSHTTGTSAVLTYDGTSRAASLTAGTIIKCVSLTGVVKYYEVASATGQTVTIRTPSTNTWLNFTDFPAPTANEFANGSNYGKIWRCTAATGNAGHGQRVTAAAAAITVGADDIDGKGRILCQAYRPD